MFEDWCPECCTIHATTQPCPGSTEATGPERHGWRVTVRTSRGTEDYGVLVAPVQRRWRSTIVTLPATPWSIPGGGGTMRFLGDSPQDAERQASDFIRRHIASAGLSIAEAPVPVAARAPVRVAAPAGEASGLPDGGKSRRAPDPSGTRKLCSLPVAFGHNAETRKARVANVSERGMFVATDEPMEPGSVVRLRLQANSFSIPIRGMVVWTRLKEEQGRMKGMGIRLFKPPALYLSFVRGLP